jgi:hypothetical protein
MDSHGNVGSGSFVVNVVDTTKPVLTLPSDIRVPATSANGAIVNYAASGGDLVDGSIAPQCTPASGSQFPIGTTQVQCTATDAHGNTATGSFSVTVGCCDVKISVSPGTVNRGQTALVTISLTNFSRKIVFGVVRFEYTSPCGHALVLQLPAILLPGKKVSFTIPFKVPRFACTGTYTLSTSGTFVDGSSTEHSATLIVR